MSTLTELSRASLEKLKFSGHDLPSAWEEDVRSNLAKHKERIAGLKQELEKEEHYVQYLETMLADLELHKQSQKEEPVTENHILPTKPETLNAETEVEKAGDDRAGFVTVITISESEKKKESEASPAKSAEKEEVESKEIVEATPEPVPTNHEENVNKVRPRAPPPPPPKHFKRQTSEDVVSAVEWTKQQIQQIGNGVTTQDAKETKNRRSSTGPVRSLSQNYENIRTQPPPRNYENVVTFPPKRIHSVDLPITDMDTKKGKSPTLVTDLDEPASCRKNSDSDDSDRRRSYENLDRLSEPNKSHGSTDSLGTGGKVRVQDLVQKLQNAPFRPPLAPSASLVGFPPVPTHFSVLPKDQYPTLPSTASLETAINEPLYDSVPLEPGLTSTGSTSTLLSHSSSSSVRSETLKSSGSDKSGRFVPNYENMSWGDVTSEEDEEFTFYRGNSLDEDRPKELDSGVFGSSVESLSGPAAGSSPTRMMIAQNVLDSEVSYLECLSVLLQYKKALLATLTTSQPLLSQDDFSVIFFKVGELQQLHSQFANNLKEALDQGGANIGEAFHQWSNGLSLYSSFLQNYTRALQTVRKCSQQSAAFADVTAAIPLKCLQGQAMSMEDLLHKPVARIQRQMALLNDLIQQTSEGDPDRRLLESALQCTKSFLQQATQRNQRHLVKEGHLVEATEGNRKLRHLFLFNDILVCAKYKMASKGKFVYEIKWFLPLAEVQVQSEEYRGTQKERDKPSVSEITHLMALRSQAAAVREQVHKQSLKEESARTKLLNSGEKQRKKLAGLEAQLMLASPNLPFRLIHRANNKHPYIFYLSSEFERSQWIEAIQAVQSSLLPGPFVPPSHDEVESYVRALKRQVLPPKMSPSGAVMSGDLHITIHSLAGLPQSADTYITIEVDSYGHFFRQAKTKMVVGSAIPRWGEEFALELEGSRGLRLLAYEETPQGTSVLLGRAELQLSRQWLQSLTNPQTVKLEGPLQHLALSLSLRFMPSEMTLRRTPTKGVLFGARIEVVCSRERRPVPLLVTSCVREVEKRGMQEIGVYRVSGSASDVAKLRKAFETRIHDAEVLLREVDIHSVTGVLKLYLRELPEALFTDYLYPKFVEAFGSLDRAAATGASSDSPAAKQLLSLFSSLPQVNQNVIVYLLEHFVRINAAEGHNKMSLHNLATVFGPTLLRPASTEFPAMGAEELAIGTVNVMAQAGILYFFLFRRARHEPIQLNTEL